MAYILDGQTLKRPNKMDVRTEEVSKSHLTLNGEVKKDIVGFRKVFTLSFQGLTQSQLNTIKTIYDKKEPVSFSVSDGDLTISETRVWVKIQSEVYQTLGSDYRADVVLVLEEVEV